MPIGTDFSVAVNGDIRHVSGTAKYTVLEFHRWLQTLAYQEQASGDDLLDIVSSTPSARATDNIITLNTPFNIDDAAAEFLYDGSIEQGAGATAVRYAGLVVVGAIAGTTTLQVVQNGTLYDGDTPFWGTGINTDPANSILCRMLIKTKDAGADIDGGRILVYAREWGHSFAEYKVTMGLGNNTAAIFTSTDLNNTTLEATVAGWTGITNTEGYQTIDLLNGDGAQPYYSQWNRDIYSINQLYERAKWLTRRGTSSTLYGLDGELFRGITHQFGFDTGGGSASFTQNEHITWGAGATAGEGILLAINSLTSATGTLWMQLLTGVLPADNATVTGATSGRHVDVAGTVTARNLSPCFLGQSTGTSLIGAFGIGVEAADLTSADKLFDLTDTLRTPPNNQQFIVYGLVNGEDRVLVTNADGSAIDFNQMLIGTELDDVAETQVDVGVGNIPADTPQTGTLRIQLVSGVYRRIAYTAHDGSRYFTIGATNFSTDHAPVGNNVFIAYIDKLADSTQLSITLKYNANRTMFVRVRDDGTAGDDKPIKTFESTSLFGAGGGSATASRIDDV